MSSFRVLFTITLFVLTASQTWNLGSNTLPRANSLMAVGYYHPYIKLIGGSKNRQGLVQFNLNSNEFIDNGTSYLPYELWDSTQFYTQISDDLLLTLAFHAQDTAHFYAYHLDTDTYEYNWRGIDISTPFGRACLTYSSQHNYIYIIYNYRTQMLNVSSLQWVTSPPSLSRSRFYFTCIAHESSNKVYVIGGATNINIQSHHFKSIEYLDISDMSIIGTKSWMDNPSNLTYPAMYLRSVAYHDFIYVIGGLMSGGGLVSKTQIINTVTNSVSLGASFYDDGLAEASVVIINNVIYAFGGRISGGIFNIYQHNTMYVIISRSLVSINPLCGYICVFLHL